MLFDVGREGNIHYIVMELIEGRVLSDLIKEEGPMDPRRAFPIAKQMASALSTAHKNHIIHRDVKPHNILLTEDGTAKITDFASPKAVNSGTIVGNRTLPSWALCITFHRSRPEAVTWTRNRTSILWGSYYMKC